MVRRMKYHAKLRFHGEYDTPLCFTAVDLEHLLKRVQTECLNKQKENSEARNYVWLEPHLETVVK